VVATIAFVAEQQVIVSLQAHRAALTLIALPFDLIRAYMVDYTGTIRQTVRMRLAIAVHTSQKPVQLTERVGVLWPQTVAALLVLALLVDVSA